MINIMSKLISTAASLSKAEYPDKRHQIAVIMDSDLWQTILLNQICIIRSDHEVVKSNNES